MMDVNSWLFHFCFVLLSITSISNDVEIYAKTFTHILKKMKIFSLIFFLGNIWWLLYIMKMSFKRLRWLNIKFCLTLYKHVSFPCLFNSTHAQKEKSTSPKRQTWIKFCVYVLPDCNPNIFHSRCHIHFYFFRKL